MQYCIRCGQPTKQKQRSLLVCSKGHENWLNPVPGATAYVLDGRKVLYGVRSIEPKGGLCPPGGFLEVDETAETAALRETKEEMGIQPELVGCLGTYAADYEGRHILGICFVARYTGGVVSPGDDMSGGDPVWRDIEDLPMAQELSFPWQVAFQDALLQWWRSQNR